MFYYDILAAELAILFMLPLALQEQVMAIWMILKGFNTSEILSEPILGDTDQRALINI